MADPLDFAEIQGILLRGYGSFVHVRHFVAVVKEAAAARTLIATLIPEAGSSHNPTCLQVTTAAEWHVKPDYTLQLSFTAEGLTALGVPPVTLAGFAAEFLQGAVGNATNNCDVGESAPANWEGGMGDATHVHAIFSLFTHTVAEMDSRSTELLAITAAGFTHTYSHDGDELPDGYVHFGYRDGLSQPYLEGGPKPSRPYPCIGVNGDGSSPPGDFLLGYTNSFGTVYSQEVASTPLGKNGSFGAFRILRQEVAAFYEYLATEAPKIGITPDELAGKFLGRRRDGVPLALSETSQGPFPSDRLNMFLYAGTAPGQAASDPKGVACPMGSHLRRANPRDEIVQGGMTQQARIMRRNVPYGAAFDPANPNDGIERGLIGFFMNADFGSQFQFLMSQWLNRDDFTGTGISGADPIVGANDPATSDFTLRTSPTEATQVCGFERFVVTRASAYCFFPSMTGLRYLSTCA